MPDLAPSLRIGRLRGMIGLGRGIDYPELRSDVKALYEEYDRVRADNRHLRVTHSQLWRMVNGDELSPTARVLLSLLGIWSLANAAIVAWLGWRMNH